MEIDFNTSNLLDQLPPPLNIPFLDAKRSYESQVRGRSHTLDPVPLPTGKEYDFETPGPASAASFRRDFVHNQEICYIIAHTHNEENYITDELETPYNRILSAIPEKKAFFGLWIPNNVEEFIDVSCLYEQISKEHALHLQKRIFNQRSIVEIDSNGEVEFL